MIYDVNNLFVSVCKVGNLQSEYFYDANGKRFRKYDGVVYTNYFNGADGNTEAITQSNFPTATYNLWGVDNIGKVIRNGTTLTRYYYLKDHLGSVRMTVDAVGNRQSWNDYYPYGLLMDDRNKISGDTDPRYKLRHQYYEIDAAEIPLQAGFTGKERDVKTGYDYGVYPAEGRRRRPKSGSARYYDSRIGRWLSVDPMAEKYAGWSCYCYVVDNPLVMIDESGLDTLLYARSGQLVELRKSENEVTYVQDVKGKVRLNGGGDRFTLLGGDQSNWVYYMDAIFQGLISAKSGVNLFSIRSDLAKWLADLACLGNTLMITSTNRDWPKGSLHTLNPAQGVDIGMVNGVRYSWGDREGGSTYERATAPMIGLAFSQMPASGAQVIGPNFYWKKNVRLLTRKDFRDWNFTTWKIHLTHVHLGVR